MQIAILLACFFTLVLSQWSGTSFTGSNYTVSRTQNAWPNGTNLSPPPPLSTNMTQPYQVWNSSASTGQAAMDKQWTSTVQNMSLSQDQIQAPQNFTNNLPKQTAFQWTSELAQATAASTVASSQLTGEATNLQEQIKRLDYNTSVNNAVAANVPSTPQSPTQDAFVQSCLILNAYVISFLPCKSATLASLDSALNVSIDVENSQKQECLVNIYQALLAGQSSDYTIWSQKYCNLTYDITLKQQSQLMIHNQLAYQNASIAEEKAEVQNITARRCADNYNTVSDFMANIANDQNNTMKLTQRIALCMQNKFSEMQNVTNSSITVEKDTFAVVINSTDSAWNDTKTKFCTAAVAAFAEMPIKQLVATVTGASLTITCNETAYPTPKTCEQIRNSSYAYPMSATLNMDRQQVYYAQAAANGTADVDNASQSQLQTMKANYNATLQQSLSDVNTSTTNAQAAVNNATQKLSDAKQAFVAQTTNDVSASELQIAQQVLSAVQKAHTCTVAAILAAIQVWNRTISESSTDVMQAKMNLIDNAMQYKNNATNETMAQMNQTRLALFNCYSRQAYATEVCQNMTQLSMTAQNKAAASMQAATDTLACLANGTYRIVAQIKAKVMDTSQDVAGDLVCATQGLLNNATVLSQNLQSAVQSAATQFSFTMQLCTASTIPDIESAVKRVLVAIFGINKTHCNVTVAASASAKRGLSQTNNYTVTANMADTSVPQAPAGNGPSPSSSGNAPSSSGNAPSSSGNAPSSSGNAPSSSGNGPSPSSSGDAPSSSGNGPSPSSSGNAPSSGNQPVGGNDSSIISMSFVSVIALVLGLLYI